jgi:hypothetical protein
MTTAPATWLVAQEYFMRCGLAKVMTSFAGKLQHGSAPNSWVSNIGQRRRIQVVCARGLIGTELQASLQSLIIWIGAPESAPVAYASWTLAVPKAIDFSIALPPANCTDHADL